MTREDLRQMESAREVVSLAFQKMISYDVYSFMARDIPIEAITKAYLKFLMHETKAHLTAVRDIAMNAASEEDDDEGKD